MNLIVLYKKIVFSNKTLQAKEGFEKRLNRVVENALQSVLRTRLLKCF